MRATRAELNVHLVWSTWDRLPLITRDVEWLLYREISEAARRSGAEVRAIGGIEDHIHVLVRMPAHVSVSDLAKRLKGSSSHLVSALNPSLFKWQGSYAAFSVSRWDVGRIERYVRLQKEHHGAGTLSRHLEPGSED